MKLLTTTLLFFFSIQVIFSQNLVPNPSFELIECFESEELNPRFTGFKYWYNPNNATPDAWGLYDSCRVNSMFDPSVVFSGEFQIPRTDTTMAGLFTFSEGAPSRDLIGVKLLEPLIQDTLYYASMWVSKGNRHNFGNDGTGFLFSEDSLFINEAGILGGLPQMYQPSGEVIMDTVNWVQISGTFQANGGEQYLYVGNHFSNEETSFIETLGSANHGWAYYFVDDLEVVKYSTLLGQADNSDVSEVKWIVQENRLQLLGDISGEWTIYDMSGRLVEQFVVEESEQTFLWTHYLTAGIYICSNKEKRIRWVIE